MKSTDWDFVIARRFTYWVYLPAEIQSKILSYFKFDVVYCLKFMRVSKSFKRHVELMHLDIFLWGFVQKNVGLIRHGRFLLIWLEVLRCSPMSKRLIEMN